MKDKRNRRLPGRGSETDKSIRPDFRDDGDLVSFSPSEYLSGERNHVRRKSKKRRRMTAFTKWMLVLIPVLVIVMLALVRIYYDRLSKDPGSFFAVRSTPVAALTPAPTAEPEMRDQTPVTTPVPTPTATPTALEMLQAQADTETMNNIINIALIGVDYAVERETWNGKHEYHADVIMVMAVNFTEKRVDLISIPRDTYAEIPGVKGIYKINASINCGGGFEAEGGTGFLKTCEAASWMLGGIPVDYYYAVTMPAVKELVDIFGGVDYNLDVSFSMAGRKYFRGQQHMNGQAVLDYLRVRKNVAKSGDNNRINRQKEMLVALFKQVRANNVLLKIPEIISTFDGQLFTNCSFSQTAALASFAYDLDPARIGMYSMDGRYTSIFGWNFTLTDQEKRVGIIRKVYGIDMPINWEYTETYARYRWQSMLAEKYIRTTTKFKDKAAAAIRSGHVSSGGANVPKEIPTVSSGGGIMGYPVRLFPSGIPSGILFSSQSAYDAYSGFISAYNEVQEDLSYARREAAKYVKQEKNKLSSAVSALSGSAARLKSYANSCNDYLGLGYSFGWSLAYWKDPDFNEVYVDFR